MTKNMLMKFRNEKVGFREVKQIAQHLVWQFKSTKKSTTWEDDIVKDIMKHKRKDAIECAKESKEELRKSKKNLDNVIRKGTFVRQEYMDLVDKELNIIWNKGKEKNNSKNRS